MRRNVGEHCTKLAKLINSSFIFEFILRQITLCTYICMRVVCMDLKSRVICIYAQFTISRLRRYVFYSCYVKTQRLCEKQKHVKNSLFNLLKFRCEKSNFSHSNIRCSIRHEATDWLPTVYLRWLLLSAALLLTRTDVGPVWLAGCSLAARLLVWLCSRHRVSISFFRQC